MNVLVKRIDRITMQKFCEDNDFTVYVNEVATDAFVANLGGVRGFTENHDTHFYDVVGRGPTAEDAIAALADSLSGGTVYRDNPTTRRFIELNGIPETMIDVPQLVMDPKWKLKG